MGGRCAGNSRVLRTARAVTAMGFNNSIRNTLIKFRAVPHSDDDNSARSHRAERSDFTPRSRPLLCEMMSLLSAQRAAECVQCLRLPCVAECLSAGTPRSRTVHGTS